MRLPIAAGFIVLGAALPWALHAEPVPKDRSLAYEDLIGLVDLDTSPEMDFQGVAVSPDGAYLALETARASLERNALEIRWVVIDLKDPEKRIDLGLDGEPISAISSAAPQPIGVRRPQRPLWAPDSQWLVFSRRQAGSTQLWRVSRNGSQQEQLTRNPAEVERYWLSVDGRKVLFDTRPADQKELQGHAAEADRGYLYDERFSPLLSTTPTSIGAQARLPTIWAYEFESRHERLATVLEQEEFTSELGSAGTENKRWWRHREQGGVSAWLEPIVGALDVERPLRVVARADGAGGRARSCGSESCRGHFKGLWLDTNGSVVYFLRWVNGRNYGALGLYSWRIGALEPHQILRTDDLLRACAISRSHLVCVRETAIKPAHIVRIDLRESAWKVVYDPNPRFDRIRFGEVTSLTWKNADAIEGFGHLVKPIGYRPQNRYPLVVVQYRSRGFLRGGVGDEYPIHILASKGFAVLSFDRPTDWEILEKFDSEEQRERALWRQQRDRRRVLSVLRAGIDELDRIGMIDPTRVGVSGLSDGANTATYALIHAPRLFAAAAVAGTYWNPMLYSLAGPLLQPRLQWFGLGFPEAGEADDNWRQLSVALNAPSIEAPLLIQVSDAELLPETQAVAALQHYDKPVEMHVFPNEFHIKMQPRHKLSAYKRGVQWFEFWLQGKEDSDPIDAGQYDRWRRLRARRAGILLATPPLGHQPPRWNKYFPPEWPLPSPARSNALIASRPEPPWPPIRNRFCLPQSKRPTAAGCAATSPRA